MRKGIVIKFLTNTPIGMDQGLDARRHERWPKWEITCGGYQYLGMDHCFKILAQCPRLNRNAGLWIQHRQSIFEPLQQCCLLIINGSTHNSQCFERFQSFQYLGIPRKWKQGVMGHIIQYVVQSHMNTHINGLYIVKRTQGLYLKTIICVIGRTQWICGDGLIRWCCIFLFKSQIAW